MSKYTLEQQIEAVKKATSLTSEDFAAKQASVNTLYTLLEIGNQLRAGLTDPDFIVNELIRVFGIDAETPVPAETDQS